MTPEQQQDVTIEFTSEIDDAGMVDSVEAMVESDPIVSQMLHISIDREEEMMRTYLMAAERLEDTNPLREKLVKLAEGNARRSAELIELVKLCD